MLFRSPEGFLHIGNGQFDYNAPLTWPSLPTDGYQSFNVGGVVAPATPTNFNGDTVTFSPPDMTDPEINNLPVQPLVIESNLPVSSMDAAVTDFFSPITCSDDADPTPDLVINFPVSFDVDTETDVSLTCTDDAGNTSSTLVVLEDNATNASTVDHAGLGNFDISALNLDYGNDTNLVLTEAQIKAMSSATDELTVHGGADDTLTVSGAVDTGQTRMIDGQTYNVYTIGNDGATLIVDHEVNVII